MIVNIDSIEELDLDIGEMTTVKAKEEINSLITDYILSKFKTTNI